MYNPSSQPPVPQAGASVSRGASTGVALQWGTFSCLPFAFCCVLSEVLLALSLRFKTGASGSTQPNIKIEYFFTVLFVLHLFRESEAQISNFSTARPLKWWGREPRGDEMIRTSIRNLKAFTVTSFFYRSINCNSSFSYSPGSPACPALFGTFYFIAAPHHGLFKGKTGLRICSRKPWGQLAAGSMLLRWAPVLMRMTRVRNSPGPEQRYRCCRGESSFWRTE